jgi:hypothetical protein
MRINPNILNIPPYLSTHWENIHSLTTAATNDLYRLTVHLTDGTQIEIPNLSKDSVENIFAAHAQFHENPSPMPSVPLSYPSDHLFNLTGVKGLETVLQHNEKEYNGPNLPSDVINKLSELTQKMSPEEINAIPKPEPHCNCPHCQIIRAIHSGALDSITTLTENEEVISEEDLQFRTWDIQQKTEALYEVRDPLESESYYHVFLGSPIGCTCGSKSCEHIKAVLSS